MAVVNPNPQEYRNPLAYAAKMLFNKGTPLSDLWLPVRINGDMAAMRGIMKEMLAEEERKPGSVFDREFIEQYTVGFDAFVEQFTRDGLGRHHRGQRIDPRSDSASGSRSRCDANASSVAGRWD